MDWNEKRQHFRIEDEVCFDFCVIEAKDALNEAAIIKRLLGENGVRYQEVMQYFQAIDDQLTDNEYNLDKKDQVLFQCLKLINNKINYLTSSLLLSSREKSRLVNLSLNGISFKNNDYIAKNTHLKVRINTKPQLTPIILDAKIVYCKIHSDERYRIAATFLDLTPGQEHLLNQHLLSVQTQQRLD